MPSPKVSEKTASVGERRLATILVADIPGFTAMSEKVGAMNCTAIPGTRLPERLGHEQAPMQI
jgi:class 3 adenylate cyclase